MRVIESVRLTDLDEAQKQLAEIIGIENYLKLVDIYGGTSIYIKKPDGFLRASRNEQIKEEFNGYNYRQLATKYDLSEVQIRSIVADRVKEVRARPIDGQINIFDVQAKEA